MAQVLRKTFFTLIALAMVIGVLPVGRTASAAETMQAIWVRADGTGDYTTINEAVNAAQPGDTIMVADGVYRETVRFPRGGTDESNRITLKAENQYGAVIKASDVPAEEGYNWVQEVGYTYKLTLPNSYFNGNMEYDGTITYYNPFGTNWPAKASISSGGVYINNKELRQAQSLSEVNSKEYLWYAEVNNATQTTTIYANFNGMNPNTDGNVAEIHRRKQAVIAAWNQGYITVDGFTIMHGSAPKDVNYWRSGAASTDGALWTSGGHHWIVENSFFTQNRGVALDYGLGSAQILLNHQTTVEGGPAERGYHILRNNVIKDNGTNGMFAYKGPYTLIQGNSFINNNSLNTGLVSEAYFKDVDEGIGIQVIGNYFYSDQSYTTMPIWLDSECQETRVSQNVFVNMGNLNYEANFGINLVDNNVFINSGIANWETSQTYYVHNLFMPIRNGSNTFVEGSRVIGGERWDNNYRRFVLYEPGTLHEINEPATGFFQIRARYNKAFNNIFYDRGFRSNVVEGSPFNPADTYSYGNEINHNVYYNGAKKLPSDYAAADRGYTADADSVEIAGNSYSYNADETSSEITIYIDGANTPVAMGAPPMTGVQMGENKFLANPSYLRISGNPGSAAQPGTFSPVMRFEPDVDMDFFGNARSMAAGSAVVGPFVNLTAGENNFTVWNRPIPSLPPFVEKKPGAPAMVDDAETQTIAYIGSGWTQGADPESYDQTLSSSSVYRNAASFTFYGNYIEYYTKRAPDGATLQILVDGEVVDTFNGYNDTPDYMRAYQNDTLALGEHTIEVRNAGTGSGGGGTAYIDYFKYGTAYIGGSVKITGTPKVDETLTADTTGVVLSNQGGVKYRWMRGTEIIRGATSETYTLLPKDLRSDISVEVSPINGYGALISPAVRIPMPGDPVIVDSKETDKIISAGGYYDSNVTSGGNNAAYGGSIGILNGVPITPGVRTNMAEFTFYGNYIKLVTKQGAQGARIGIELVDDQGDVIDTTEVNTRLSSGGPYFQQVAYQKMDLPLKAYTIHVWNAGLGDPAVSNTFNAHIDYFEYGTVLPQGPTTVQSADKRITYSGTAQNGALQQLTNTTNWTNASAAGSYLDHIMQSSTLGSTIELEFEGSYIKVYGRKAPAGGHGLVTIDGIPYLEHIFDNAPSNNVTFDAYSSTAYEDQLWFEAHDLDPAVPHRITIENKGKDPQHSGGNNLHLSRFEFGTITYNTIGELNDLITTADLLDNGVYTEESWADLTIALDAAKGVAAENSSAPNAITTAYNNLQNAIGELEHSSLKTYAELQALITDADTFNKDDYIAESWTDLTAALEAAKDITEADASTAIDAAYHGLKDAMNALVLAPKVDRVEVLPAAVEVGIGDTQQFYAIVTAISGADEGVTWSLKGNSEAGTSIDDAGLLTVDPGETAMYLTITATSDFDSSKYDSATATLLDDPAAPGVIAVKVLPQTVTVQTGDSKQFSAVVATQGAVSDDSVVWSLSGNNRPGTEIGSDGMLTVAGDESASTLTVTATSVTSVTYNPISGTATVTIGHVFVTGITVTGESGATAIATRGGTLQMHADVAPYNATDDTVTWSVYGTGATISVDGLLTAIANGMVTVRATANDGTGVYGQATITISGQNSSSGNDGGDGGNGGDGSDGGNSGGNGSDGDGGMPPVSNTNEIPLSDLTASGKQKTIKVENDIATVTVPSNMLTGVAGISGKNAEISISEGNRSTLPDNVKAVIGDRPLISLVLKIDGKQTGWSNPNAPVMVGIPYTPTADELKNPDAIVVYYIDGSGNLNCVTNGHYDPATGTVTFKTTHFSLYAVGYNKVSFKDVAAGVWYYKPVSFIAAREITNGTGNGNYSPDAKLTRGQFIVMLMKAYGIAPDTNPTDNFSDAGSAYYTDYLSAAKRLGISSGVGNNMFLPEKNITRQETFTLLYNALKAIGQLPQGDSHKAVSQFTDALQIAPWAQDAMTLLVKTGTVSGSGSKLNPADTTTRAEMAQVLYNLLGK